MPDETTQSDGPSALRSIAVDVGVQWFTDLAEYAITGLGEYSEDAVLSALSKSFETGRPTGEFLSEDDDNAPEDTPAGDEVVPQESPDEIPHLRFERVGPFTDFRRLGDPLALTLARNITLVFGRNGSGKSSICMALRCLAKDSPPPGRMRHANSSTTIPSFTFRLEGRDADETWTESVGFGTFVHRMMYFDGAIAHSLIRDPAGPEQAVNVEPFRLEVIKECGRLLGRLQGYIAAEVQSRLDNTATKFETVRKACDGITFLSKAENPNEQDEWLKELAETSVNWDEENETACVNEQESELERLGGLLTPDKQIGLSEEIQAQTHRISGVKSIIDELQPIADGDEQATEEARASKTEVMNRMLATELDSDEAKEMFVRMLDAANKHSPLSSDLEACPLCEQPLESSAKTRFDEYKELLASSLKADIDAATRKLHASKRTRDTARQRITAFDSSWITELDGIAHGDIEETTTAIMQPLCADTGQFKATAEFADCIRRLRVLIIAIAAKRRIALLELDDLKVGAEKTRKAIAETKEKIRDLLSRRFRSRQAESISAYTHSKSDHARLQAMSEAVSWQGMRTRLSTRRRNITNDLAKESFTDALDSEYKTITDGYGMDHFGVVIGTRTAQQTTQFAQSIGTTECELPDVLSEGEQRLHAMAMFFAEACVSKPEVLVFDDPSVSFDYNYIEGVSTRLWEFARDNRESQIIVFTHSWEFFFKTYDILMNENSIVATKLDMSFLELEECAKIQDHKARLSAHNQKVEAGLNALNEPDTVDRTRAVCLDIRLLIEEVILKLVFNGQRQGFKTRRPATLNLGAYTKLQPLTEQQASEFAGVNRTVSDWLHSRSGDAAGSMPSKTKLTTAYESVKRIWGELEQSRAQLPDGAP